MSVREALPGTIIILLAPLLLSAGEPTSVPSPDGRFALLMGAYRTQHFDKNTSDWVTDSEEKPAAIVDTASQNVLVQFDNPLRPEEDKVLWSADSKWLAFSHRGNKTTDLRVYCWNGHSFQKATLPDLPEPVIHERPNKKSLSEQIHHFDFEKIDPLRWLTSGTLVVSHSLGFTNNTLQSISYSREYTITISFDAKQIGHIKNVTKQPQKVEEEND